MNADFLAKAVRDASALGFEYVRHGESTARFRKPNSNFECCVTAIKVHGCAWSFVDGIMDAVGEYKTLADAIRSVAIRLRKRADTIDRLLD